jgi:hypothetical protein
MTTQNMTVYYISQTDQTMDAFGMMSVRISVDSREISYVFKKSWERFIEDLRDNTAPRKEQFNEWYRRVALPQTFTMWQLKQKIHATILGLVSTSPQGPMNPPVMLDGIRFWGHHR